MTAGRLPSLDEISPDWQRTLDTLRLAEAEVASLPRGSVERRAASRRARDLGRAWQDALHMLRRARLAAGWVPTEGGLAWVYLGKTEGGA